MSNAEIRHGRGIDIPHVPVLEPGSLAWDREAREPEADDLLVHAAFRFLATPGVLPQERARGFGRALGAAARPGDVLLFLGAFSHLGLGTLRLVEGASPRYAFESSDMDVDATPTPPACSIALGFLEGLVLATTGRPALGAEVACRSRGQPACRFVVMER